MTRVALINVGRKKAEGICEPLNLGYIASYLEQNKVGVKIIDEQAGEDVSKEINAYSPDIVGITAVTPLAPRAYKIADICREKRILTVIGGVHATVMPEEALRHADIVVVGEGEVAMMDIITDDIKQGVVERPYIKNLDTLPPPARHLMREDFYLHTRDRVGDVVSHLHFVPPHTRVASILSSRGCSYRCIFCHNSWRVNPVRFNSAERVISEIKQLIDVYGAEAVFFMDDNPLANKPRLREICRIMIEDKLDIIWACNATANHIDLETAQLIREAGCVELVFGWESGSQKILDVLEKRTTVEGNTQAIKICKRAGLMVTGSLMIGNPTETPEDVKATQQFIADNKKDIDMYGVNMTTAYPGTKLWHWCEEKGLIPESFEWDHFNQQDLPVPACDTMSPKEIEELSLQTFVMQRVKLSRLWKRGLWHPFKTIVWALRYPSIVIKIIRGVINAGMGNR